MIGHFFKSIWAGAKYFVLGLAVAVLTASQTGKETRELLKQRILALFDQTLPTTTQNREHDVTGAAGLDKDKYWHTAQTSESHPVL
ncbi:MAG: YtxH domain-containing protein [Herpetosiphon sp.]|nr:YtxH domain-containing protein [Herpetosiphon sp.]